jgi:Nucleoside phosphorylase
MSKKCYTDIKSDEIKHLFNGELILIVTATDLETTNFHKRLTPNQGYDHILRLYEGNLTYFFGVFGSYKIAHVQCAMGSISRDSSIMTVSTALQKLKTKVVIMIGIAFGVDEVKQKIGDVLIAESVVPYNSKRVGRGQTIHRGIEAQSSQILLNRFKNIRTWEHLINGNSTAKLIFTRVLSGEELVDNIKYRNKLTTTFPDSKGGEMEGAGVYSACGNKIDWILVKGICDFANGDKGVNKKENQETAIESALSICLELFSSSFAFKDLDILPEALKQEIIDLKENPKMNEILFDYYDETKEEYYILRESDNTFNKIFNQYSVWLHGPSGCGKSNLIVRNLLKGGKDFIQVNLSPCIGQDIQSFFNEILYELSSKIEGVTSQIQPKNYSECSKALISLLDKNYKDKELTIFVEEIPISSEEDHKEFSEKIFSLIISKNFINGLSKVKFVLSSINDPSKNITIAQHKIHQHLVFAELKYWEPEEIILLIEVIQKELNFTLTPTLKNQLILSAKGSPRFIKKFFRSIYTLNKTDEKTLNFLIKEIERELNHI